MTLCVGGEEVCYWLQLVAWLMFLLVCVSFLELFMQCDGWYFCWVLGVVGRSTHARHLSWVWGGERCEEAWISGRQAHWHSCT